MVTEHFGGHIFRSTRDPASHRHTTVDLGRQTEITELYTARLHKKDVIGLDILSFNLLCTPVRDE